MACNRRTRPGDPAVTQAKQRKVLGVVLVAHFVIAALTWRDLRYRPAELVRGSKRVWRGASAVNTLGASAYWLFGRRRPRRSRGVIPSEKRPRPAPRPPTSSSADQEIPSVG